MVSALTTVPTLLNYCCCCFILTLEVIILTYNKLTKTSLQPSWGGNENGVHGFHENLYFPVLPFCSAVNLGPDLPPSIGCKLIIWPLDLFQEQLSILEQEYEL